MPRPTLRSAGARRCTIVLLALLASACTEPPETVEWRQLVLEDALAGNEWMSEAQHARTPPHWNLAGVRRAPLLARSLPPPPGEGVVGAGRARLPADVLLRVEIRLLPAIDCASAPAWLMDSADFARLQPVEAAAVASLGDPGPAYEAWIVPAYVLGSRPLSGPGTTVPPPQYAELALAGGHLSPEPAELSGAAFDFGPPWVGLPLRFAGAGAVLLFPPSVDCAPTLHARDDTVPRRGFSQWAHREDYVKIPQAHPFLVSLIEVCPLDLRQQEERFKVAARWPWMPRVDRWRYTGELHARCSSGELHHRSEPIVIESALGRRRLSDAYRTDIERAPPPVW